MAKKRDLIMEFNQYAPQIRDKAEKFYWRGVHVFDSHRHRLNPHIADRTEAAQVLRAVEVLGRIHERTKRFNADERKCLDSVGDSPEPSSKI